MKKILLGTTAIIAMGTLSTEAFAADKIALSLSGFHNQYVTLSSHDDGGVSMKLGQDANSEVNFGGSTTLDNGLTVKVRMEMETNGEDSGNSTDRSYLTVGSDAMGTLRLGVAAHMIDDYAVRAPMVGPNDWGDIADNINFNGIADAANNAGDLADFSGNSNKIGYHTPTFSGVTAYASYAAGGNLSVENTRAQTRAATHDEVSVGVGYEGEMGGASVAADLGHFSANGTGDVTRVGLNVGMAGFTVGGSYSDIDGEVVATAGVPSIDGNAWELGVSYETGPYSVAAAYMNSEADATTAVGTDEWTAWQVGANYDLGAGVGLVAQYVKSTYDNEGAVATGKTSGSAVVAGIEVGF